MTKKKPKPVCCYYSCRARASLKKCPHCSERFCPNHLKPIKPGVPERGAWSRGNIDKFLEDTREGHPCPPFLDFLKEKEERERKEYRETLDIVIKRETVFRGPVVHGAPTESISHKEQEEETVPSQKGWDEIRSPGRRLIERIKSLFRKI